MSELSTLVQMKGLSIRQPWAFAIEAGWKDVENRTWPTDYRGPIAIHATKPANRNDLWLDSHEMNRMSNGKITPIGPNDLEAMKEWSFKFIPKMSAHGSAIVAVADLVDCVYRHYPSPWFCGPYGFVLRNVRRIRPAIFMPGQLGLWDVHEDILEIITDRLANAHDRLTNEAERLTLGEVRP